MVTFEPLKQARENGAILLNFRCLKVIRLQRSGIDTIKYHTWPRIPMGKWQTHRRHYKREPRGQPFLSRWPQSTYKQTRTKHSKVGYGKWSNFAQFLLFESKFDHLIPYVNESKSLRRVFGQDPLVCYRFRSSQRWWHFSPLSRQGKMEQFCSIFAVWVQIWPPYTLCK